MKYCSNTLSNTYCQIFIFISSLKTHISSEDSPWLKLVETNSAFLYTYIYIYISLYIYIYDIYIIRYIQIQTHIHLYQSHMNIYIYIFFFYDNDIHKTLVLNNKKLRKIKNKV